jgi:hypothetical protein
LGKIREQGKYHVNMVESGKITENAKQNGVKAENKC